MHMQLDTMDLGAVGPLFENHSVFPARVNTEFVQVLTASPDLIS